MFFWVIDSMGKPSPGISEGNFLWPGVMHLCEKITSNSSMEFGQPNFRGKYANILAALNVVSDILSLVLLFFTIVRLDLSCWYVSKLNKLQYLLRLIYNSILFTKLEYDAIEQGTNEYISFTCLIMFVMNILLINKPKSFEFLQLLFP